jgi:two-component system C4-dicarboxylate transport sensor histidine kinase DctB
LRIKPIIQKIYILFFIFSIVVLLLFVFVREVVFETNLKDIVINNYMKESEKKVHKLRDFLDYSSDYLFSIKRMKLFNQYLNNEVPKEVLEDVLLSFAKPIGSIMQLRYLDANGMEKIRIDRSQENSGAFIVEDKKLQNKSNRYYFFDSKNKSTQKVWFSALDLNIENKKVEVPFKPTLRVMLPIEHNKKFAGVLVVNYFMKSFLDDFVKDYLYDIVLYDKYGHTLKHYDDKKSWDVFKQGSPRGIKQEYPNNYKEILHEKFAISEYFISKKLDLEVANGIILTMKFKQSYLKNEREKNIKMLMVESMIIFVLSIILAFFVVKIYLRIFNINRRLEKVVDSKTQENLKQYQVIQNQNKLVAMGEMIGAIAHQWRQPLTVLNLRIFKLKNAYIQGKIDKEYIDKFVDKNKELISFMSETIDTFRDFFRTDKENQKFNVKDSIEQVLSMMSAQIKEYQIQIDIIGDGFDIVGVKLDLQQVILNLITNSKDAFIEKDINERNIIINVEKYNVIIIKDNAGGIPIDILDRVFEPYFTTKEQGKGTGMGLYMSKMMVENNMKGNIQVRNISNGVEFKIKL